VSTQTDRLIRTGVGPWPLMNLAAPPSSEVLDGQRDAEAVDAELTSWFRRQAVQAPPTAEQLAQWWRLAVLHQADPQRGWLCLTCQAAFPCQFRLLADAALATARAVEPPIDMDPAVRLAARLTAALRTEQGYTAVVTPLLADAERIVATHRPTAGSPGLCPVCSTAGPVRWPCDLHGVAMQVLWRFGGQPPRQVDPR
jgi:hypothetical protein